MQTVGGGGGSDMAERARQEDIPWGGLERPCRAFVSLTANAGRWTHGFAVPPGLKKLDGGFDLLSFTTVLQSGPPD